MDLLVRPSRIAGRIAVPGSKSHTIRALTAALLADGESVLRAPLHSADTESVLQAIGRFGAVCDSCCNGIDWRITGRNGIFRRPLSTVDLGNSGTGLRMLTAAAALQNFPIAFDGDSSLRSRGMKGLLDSLQSLGVSVQSAGGKCPLSVCGPLRGEAGAGEVIKVDGVTSQFLTALLFVLPLRKCDTVLKLDLLYEQPYVKMTLNWLEFLGIRFEAAPDMLSYKIYGNQSYHAFERTIPADFSTAAFPLAAAALCGNDVTICNLDFSDLQGDKKVFDFAAEMGALLKHGSDLAVGRTPGKLRGRTFDLNSTPDALPVMAVLGALANGETKLCNVAQARLKETDRIAGMTSELRKMGAVIEELPDGMVIRGGSLHGAEVESFGDHRIAMALAVAGMNASGETRIRDAECASVTYPDFVTDFTRLGADFSAGAMR